MPPTTCAKHVAAPSILIGHSLGARPCRPPHTECLRSRRWPRSVARWSRNTSCTPSVADGRRSSGTGKPRRIWGPRVHHSAGVPRRHGPAASGGAHCRLHRALLVLHSPTDETVGVENAQQILDAARHPKSFIAIDGADRLLTDRADARDVAIMLAAWADRYARGPVGAGPGATKGGRTESCPTAARPRAAKTRPAMAQSMRPEAGQDGPGNRIERSAPTAPSRGRRPTRSRPSPGTRARTR